MNQVEIPLTGGQMTPGIVRVGDTVRRPVWEGATFRHEVLKLLERSGCRWAPRFLGIDGQGREILSYIEGETV